MKFEELPNELLLSLFQFLNTINLFHAFNGLNSRFNNLLFSYDQKYHLDFRSISKHDFEIVCQDYLPYMMGQIISLHLSDEDETPMLSNLFLSHGFTLNQFNYLQILSLHHINSPNRIYQMISQCRHLKHLTHLSLIQCHFWYQETDFQYVINYIWSLTRLTHCTLDYNLPGHQLLTKISIHSPSIKSLSMKNIHCDMNTLSHLFEFTPNLQQLDTTIFCGSRDEQLSITVPSILSLNIIQKSSLNTMINLFHNMLNLHQLTLETNYIYLTGYEWENILVEHLPNLKEFQLKMYFELSLSNKENQIDELLDSFRTPFWLDKHQWFVQCDWSSSRSHRHAVLYTLPYTFNEFLYDNTCQSKSTLLDDRSSRLYNHVNSLQYLEYEANSIQYLNQCLIQFSNIRHLCITLPFHNRFWFVVPMLDQLLSLDVMLNNQIAYYHLQTLVDRIPNLYSLTFRSLQNIRMPLFHLTNKSIRRLDFISMSTLPKEHFNSFECDALAKSSLGQQCHVLLIKVQNRIDILRLIETMLNLRTLIVQCEDDNQSSDELLKWLQDHLPATYSINRDLDETSKIHLWID
jgi:hypothetical protein